MNRSLRFRGKAACLAVVAAMLMFSAGLSLTQPVANLDADGDGIPDAWEVNGIDYTSSDGTHQHLDLKAAGASPRHKDVLVWVDWMGPSPGAPVHDHKPRASAIQLAKDAYAQSGLGNPDLQPGVNLIVVISPEPVTHRAVLGASGNPPVWDGSGTEASVWADFDKIKTAHFPKELSGVFHYCLFAHDLNFKDRSTSGLADIGGSDLIVALGSWSDNYGSEDEQAGTFLHELGHNMGLQHGGDDEIIRKPNYLSVMNYAFQTDGLIGPRGKLRFDYSHFALPSLNELDLDETRPLSTDPRSAGWKTLYFCQGRTQAEDAVPITLPIDWNCDGNFTEHVQEHISESSAPTLLGGYDDWNNLKWAPRINLTSALPAVRRAAAGELTLSRANGLPVPPVTGLSAVSASGPVSLSWNPLPLSRVIGYKVTRRDATGVGSEVTTYEARYTDASKRRGTAATYEVQALYLPHGASQNLSTVPGNSGKFQTLQIAGIRGEASMLAVDGLDSRQLDALKKESRVAAQKLSKLTGPSGVDLSQLESAVAIRNASVVLTTKAVSVTVR